MDPQTFQTNALAWVGVISVVGLAVITCAATLWNAIQTKLLVQKTDANKERLDRHAQKIDAIQTNMPPPNQPIAIATSSSTPETAAPTLPDSSSINPSASPDTTNTGDQ